MAVGFIFVALSATCLGVMPSFRKQVLLDGLPMNSLMFYVNWIITLVCLVMALVKKRRHTGVSGYGIGKEKEF